MTKLLYTLLLAFGSLLLSAQENAEGVQMADTFRQEGKIYVVITVIGIIFLALIAYMIRVDVKLKRIEQKQD